MVKIIRIISSGVDLGTVCIHSLH